MQAIREVIISGGDALMLGEVQIPGLFFQLDSPTGRYEDLEYGLGYRGPRLDYRKLEKLEKDPLFWALIRRPLFETKVARSGSRAGKRP